MGQFKEQQNLTEEEVDLWIKENQTKRFLGKEMPALKENEILIIRASPSGDGKTFFIKQVQDQKWLSSYLAKGSFRSKEFYILSI